MCIDKIKEKLFKPALIIKIEILIVLFERVMMQTLNMPRLIVGTVDFLNLILLFFLFRNKEWKKYTRFIVTYLVILVVSLIVGILNFNKYGGNICFSLIEVRNIARFPIFFLSCAIFLDEEDWKFIYKILVIFCAINSLIILYQYFTYHPDASSRGDFLNGLFGKNERGGNTFVNVLMLVVLTYMISAWRNKQIASLWFFIAVCVCLLIAALIELKAFFFEVLVIYGWYLICYKKSKKELLLNIILIALAVLVSVIGLSIMYREYPNFKGYMSIDGIKDQLFGNGYTGQGDLNRFTGIFTIESKFFNHDFIKTMFGVGLGNASESSILGTTLFYDTYANSNYKWFVATYMFTQTGVFGLILYLSTFLFLFFKKKENDKYRMNTQIMCLLALLLVFYNDTFLTDAGYLVYFALAGGFVKSKVSEENKMIIQHN